MGIFSKTDVDTVIVEFYNDQLIGIEDRNLYVAFLEIGGDTILSTASNIIIDEGKLDGIDIIQGKEVMAS